MHVIRTGLDLDENIQTFYAHSIDIVKKAEIPFLVGGAYAVERYTGLIRPTNDFDIFVLGEHVEPALAAFEKAGYRSELTFPHWLGKAHFGDKFVDVIYSSGNGVAPVDGIWFEKARTAIVFGREVGIVPPEESIWSKAFIMERERYDGADVAHLIEACGKDLDWHRLVRRFGTHWRVLFAHLILNGYIYPSRQDIVPAWVMRTMSDRLAADINDDPLPLELCRGPVLSRAQYLSDVEAGAMIDARMLPFGRMTAEEIEHWTDAIEQEK
ncbi:MAG TPA: hypothetical protein VM557_03355 [Thermoanaerobaculia bacterium]|nr:hypothetical protein [Thermoanaerobaculia bacterium]